MAAASDILLARLASVVPGTLTFTADESGVHAHHPALQQDNDWLSAEKPYSSAMVDAWNAFFVLRDSRGLADLCAMSRVDRSAHFRAVEAACEAYALASHAYFWFHAWRTSRTLRAAKSLLATYELHASRGRYAFTREELAAQIASLPD